MDLLKELHKKSPTLKGVLNFHLVEIKQGLSEGYSKKEIYDLLKNSNLIKSDYFYFVKILNQILSGEGSQSKKKKVPSTSDFQPRKEFKMMELDEDDLK